MKFIKSFLIILLSFLLIGCSTSSKKESPDKNSNKTPSETKFYSPFTNEEVDKSTSYQTPFMVIVENSIGARPQRGLSSADIIYETSAEGGIPRFIALFQKAYPEIIGPVRSVRPYFIDIAEMYNLPFAHCGGSEEALTEITSSSSLMSINEINNGSYFWRSKDRVAPHNLYTSSSNIINFINSKQWNSSYNNILTFDNNYFKSSELPSVNAIKIINNKYYNTSYEFNNNLFTKYMDGVKTIDLNNNEPLTFSNIVIQKTNITLSSDNTHLNIPLTGSGEGYVISQGKYTPITWNKDSEGNKTILKDKDGNIVPLSSGKTIWHIIDNDTEVTLQ